MWTMPVGIQAWSLEWCYLLTGYDMMDCCEWSCWHAVCCIICYWSLNYLPGQVLLLEAEDDMKSKRISEIQDVLAEKMQDLPLLADSAVLVTLVAAAELMPQDLDVLKMELRQKEAEFAVDGLCIIMVVSGERGLVYGVSISGGFLEIDQSSKSVGGKQRI